MLLGFNLLLWTTHVTEEHFPLFGGPQARRLRRRRGAAVRGQRRALRDDRQRAARPGAGATGVTVLPDEAHIAPSAPTRRRAQGALDRLALGGRLPAGLRRRRCWAGRSTSRWACSPATRRPRPSWTGWSRCTSQAARLCGAGRDQAVGRAAQPVRVLRAQHRGRRRRRSSRRVDRPNYGLLYDTFHANIEEKDPIGVIAAAPRAHQPRPHLRERPRHAGQGARAVGDDLRGAEGGRLRRLADGSRRSAARCRRWPPRPGSGAISSPTREEVYHGHGFLVIRDAGRKA